MECCIRRSVSNVQLTSRNLVFMWNTRRTRRLTAASVSEQALWFEGIVEDVCGLTPSIGIGQRDEQCDQRKRSGEPESERRGT